MQNFRSGRFLTVKSNRQNLWKQRFLLYIKTGKQQMRQNSTGKDIRSENMKIRLYVNSWGGIS